MEESQAPNIKQVIVMRHDLKMRRGKQIAQGAHASMSFLTRKLQSKSSICMDDFTPHEQTWIMGSFAKVCVRCNSEEELMEIHDKAIEMGLNVQLITDSGRTEFHGTPARLMLRKKIVLAEAEGKQNIDIATELNFKRETVRL